MSTDVRLSANEKTALRAWADFPVDFDVLSFRSVAKNSGLERRLVRRTVRALARKGLAEFHQGCWTEDGEMAGSGYGLTEAGRALLAEQPS